MAFSNTNTNDVKYTKGTTVLYKSSQSQGLIGVARVLILDVHTDDDLVPYYSIKLPDGREKQTDQYHILPDNEESINHLLSSDTNTDNIKEAVKKESVSVVDQETSTVFTSSSIATIPKEKLSAKERLLVSKALKQSKYNEPKDTASSTMANIGGYHPPPTPIRQPKKKRIGTLSDLDRLPGKQLASQTGGRSKASRSRNDKSNGGRSTEVRNVSPLSSSRSVSSSGQLRFQRSQSNTNEDNPPVKSTFASRRRRSVDSLQKLSITLKEKNYK